MKNKKEHRFNLVLLIVTLVLSPLVILAALNLAGALLPGSGGIRLQPLLIGLSFLFIGLLTGLIVLVTSLIGKSYVGDLRTGEKKIFRTLLMFLLCLVILFGAGAGLEFLYEKALWASNSESNEGTYVFLVDDSGSTEDSDPLNLRYQAINQILGSIKGGQYMVYSFADETQIVRPMTPISGQLPDLRPVDGTITEMKTALEKVMEDYKNGVWSAVGPTKVILMTDGAATDLEAGEYSALSVLNEYRAENIKVSTVGLGQFVDRATLQYIADTTGGEFVPIEDSTQIVGAMQQAAGMGNLSYNLLTPRPLNHNTVLLGILRVLFLTILGLLISLGCTICTGYSKTIGFTMLSGLGLSLAGALLVEIVYLLAGYFPVWYLLLIPFATVLAMRGDGSADHHGTKRYDAEKDWESIREPAENTPDRWTDEEFFSRPAAPKKGRKSKNKSSAPVDPFEDFDL